MITTSARLSIGSFVGFLTGLGILGFSSQDSQYMSSTIDSVIGGVFSLISLVYFLEHHLQKHQAEMVTPKVTITGSTQVVPVTQ